MIRVTERIFCDELVTLDITEEIEMTVQSHVAELRKKHQNLSDQVERAQRMPAADDLAIASMKKEKLRLKQEIERLTH